VLKRIYLTAIIGAGNLFITVNKKFSFGYKAGSKSAGFEVLYLFFFL
jgi:hypothetical protein